MHSNIDIKNPLLRVVFFGTPQFSADTLLYLLDKGVNVVGVITKPDKPKGRSLSLVPTPVKEVAIASHLPFFQPEIISSNEFMPILEQFQADLFVVVAYGEILKQHILDIPKKGCINLHTSLLPKYRGAAPIQQCIIHGEKESGVSIIHMVKKMDAGDVIAVKKVPIPEEMTYGELEKELCLVGSELLLNTISLFADGIPKSVSQNPEEVTFAPKIELENCRIDWSKSADAIHNLVRGVNPEPGAFCFVNIKNVSKRLRVISTKKTTLLADAASVHATPGTILSENKKEFKVVCGDGSLLEILKVQPEGKKPMSFADYLRGTQAESMN